jgi:hypothetical protein
VDEPLDPAPRADGPSPSSATECALPAATAVADGRVTLTGTVWKICAPLPSWPASLVPQARNVPSERTAIVKL